MNEDLDNIQFRHIEDYKYEDMFIDVQPTDVILDDVKRQEVVDILDERIAQCVEGLNLIYGNLKSMQSEDSGFIYFNEPIHSFTFFTTQTTADCLVAFKYFIVADTDYDRSFMRGKLKVILNEGFKKLYGFNNDNKKNSEWRKLNNIIDHFPEKIQQQYQKLTDILEEQANKSSWWKEERNIETHIDTIKLYESRQESINECKVMLETFQLINALSAVDAFVTNLNACVVNYLLDKYKKGELRVD